MSDVIDKPVVSDAAPDGRDPSFWIEAACDMGEPLTLGQVKHLLHGLWGPGGDGIGQGDLLTAAINLAAVAIRSNGTGDVRTLTHILFGLGLVNVLAFAHGKDDGLSDGAAHGAGIAAVRPPAEAIASSDMMVGIAARAHEQRAKEAAEGVSDVPENLIQTMPAVADAGRARMDKVLDGILKAAGEARIKSVFDAINADGGASRGEGMVIAMRIFQYLFGSTVPSGRVEYITTFQAMLSRGLREQCQIERLMSADPEKDVVGHA